MFVNHLCEAKSEQEPKANKAEESFDELVIAGGDPPVALDYLEKVFYPMTTSIELCGEWYSCGAVSATRNAGFNPLSGRCLSEGRAIIGFVANKGRILWQALRKPDGPIAIQRKQSTWWPAIPVRRLISLRLSPIPRWQ